MSTTPTKKQMDRAKAIVDCAIIRWKTIMGLGSWIITTNYYRDDASLPKRYRKQAKLGWGALMWVQVNWEYLDARVNVALHRVYQRTKEELANDVRHELAHIVVNEMREHFGKNGVGGGKHEERVVTVLSYAFREAHVTGWNEGRDHLRKQQKVKGKFDSG